VGNVTICTYNEWRFINTESTEGERMTTTNYSRGESYQVLPNGDIQRIEEEWSPDESTDQEAVKSTAELLSALHDKGVTYQAVADELGVNWRTVHRWRNGQTHPATAGLVNVALKAMLRVVSVPVYDVHSEVEKLKTILPNTQENAPF
jgi:DNA-binding transcriptional regulator YiaG